MFKRSLKHAALTLSLAAFGAMALASDWPNYRGPTYDQHSDEKIATQWPADGPKQVWKRPVGLGIGTFAVVKDKAAFFQANSGNEEVIGLNANTGDTTWTYVMGKTTNDRQGGPGPRSTPTIDGDKVYVLSTYLKLACLNLADGKEVWVHDLMKEFSGQKIGWDNAMSPVIEGNRVIVAGGGQGQTFLAFDKNSGALSWKTGSEKITHATATPTTIHGQRQIIFYVQNAVVSVNPETGAELWRHKYEYKTSTAASPVVWNDMVYCSAGYNVGGTAIRVSKDWEVQELWRIPGNREVASHWSTPVAQDGYLYGLFGHNEANTGPMKCVDMATGKIKWAKPGFGPAGVIFVDGNILATTDQGHLVLVKATPEGYTEIAKSQPLKMGGGDNVWTMPVLANGKVYMHGRKEAVCVDVSPK